MDLSKQFQLTADALRSAEALVITAGAGMGVDSGLPDFRGDKGFWKAYPPYERLGISFVQAANPIHFARDPAFGWGFYGHRLKLYRQTVPHEGFNLLLSWAERFGLDYFVATSNVDGHFQKAGFAEDRVLEVHGSIHYLQCLTPCSGAIWENTEEIPVDTSTMRAEYVPRCIHCGATARPNILMFGDFSWISDRTDAQEKRFYDFLSRHRRSKTVVIEIGAGTAVPTIRRLTEQLSRSLSVTAVRINTREPFIAAPHISLPCGALESLKAIDSLLG